MEQIRAEDGDLGSDKKVQEAKGDLGAEVEIHKPESTLFLLFLKICEGLYFPEYTFI
jgi:hypothetical protein